MSERMLGRYLQAARTTLDGAAARIQWALNDNDKVNRLTPDEIETLYRLQESCREGMTKLKPITKRLGVEVNG